LYLLSSVRMLRPELWTRDWLAHTHHYHPLYAELGALMLRLDPTGWAIGLANVAAVGGGMSCVYRLLRLLLDAPQAFVGFMLVLTLAGVSSTDAVGGSYVFADIFQPSTLDSVGLLGACLAFVSGRWLLAGLCLAFAGAFHLNTCCSGCVYSVWQRAALLARAALARSVAASLAVAATDLAGQQRLGRPRACRRSAAPVSRRARATPLPGGNFRRRLRTAARLSAAGRRRALVQCPKRPGLRAAPAELAGGFLR
jgi:hypothetical protein